MQKIFLECSIRQLNNEFIASPYDGGLIVSRHAITNDVIFSDTMLRYLTRTQLRSMTDHHKMMCGCAICNTSKYFKELLNSWWRKKLKIMNDKADNSCARRKDEFTQTYKSYAD